MALNATSPEHQMQIIAGTEGRKKGHKFEKTLTEHINELDNKLFYPVEGNTLHVFLWKSSRDSFTIYSK